MDDRLQRCAREDDGEALALARLRAGLCPICGVNQPNEEGEQHENSCCCYPCWGLRCASYSGGGEMVPPCPTCPRKLLPYTPSVELG